jgi:hypothetical protein
MLSVVVPWTAAAVSGGHRAWCKRITTALYDHLTQW